LYFFFKVRPKKIKRKKRIESWETLMSIQTFSPLQKKERKKKMKNL